jgi:hypothetical protein
MADTSPQRRAGRSKNDGTFCCRGQGPKHARAICVTTQNIRRTMAFAASATCQLSEDKAVALPRCADGEFAFAYGSEVVRGGFHRWTVTLSREPAENDADGGAASTAGEAPLGFGVCVGVAASGAPTRRLPPELRVVPTACTAGRGVHLDRSSDAALGAPRFGPLPAGTPDMTAVWDGKMTHEGALEAAAIATDHTAAPAAPDNSEPAASADAAAASPTLHAAASNLASTSIAASNSDHRRRRSEGGSGKSGRSLPATPGTPSTHAPLLSDAAAAAQAWGYNPLTHALYASADARRWGAPLVVLPPPQPGETIAPSTGSLELTICVDLGERPSRLLRPYITHAPHGHTSPSLHLPISPPRAHLARPALVFIAPSTGSLELTICVDLGARLRGPRPHPTRPSLPRAHLFPPGFGFLFKSAFSF